MSPSRWKSVRQDALVSQYQLNPGFLKVDVEGAEHRLFPGSEQLLRVHRPVIIAELSMGTIGSWCWVCEFRDDNGIRPENILESDQWIEGYERVADTAAGLCDTRYVFLADREADIVSLMYRAAEFEHPADWLIRSKHNRTLPDGESYGRR